MPCFSPVLYRLSTPTRGCSGIVGGRRRHRSHPHRMAADGPGHAKSLLTAVFWPAWVDVERRNAIDWWNGSMATRLNDFSSGHKVVIQQRLHEADLTGDLL